MRSSSTVEPARDSDVIFIKVLDATQEQAGALAESVARAYRDSVARQAAESARQEVAAIAKRQEQLTNEITNLDQQLADDPGDQRLLANREAKPDQLADLADQIETDPRRRPRGRPAGPRRVREWRPSPRTAQPKPLRNAVIGALLALVVSAGLAGWLNGRRLENQRLLDSLAPSSAVARGAARADRQGDAWRRPAASVATASGPR